MRITVADNFPGLDTKSNLRSRYLVLAEKTYELVAALFCNPPPLGGDEIKIEQGGNVITDAENIRDGSGYYWIQLAIGDEDGEAQFIYELGHELGHVFIGPRCTNFIAESIATAVSVEALIRQANLEMEHGCRTDEFLRRTSAGFRLALPADVRDAVEREDWNGLAPALRSYASRWAFGSEARKWEHAAALAFRAVNPTWAPFLGFAHRTAPQPIVSTYMGVVVPNLSLVSEEERRGLCAFTEVR